MGKLGRWGAVLTLRRGGRSLAAVDQHHATTAGSVVATVDRSYAQEPTMDKADILDAIREQAEANGAASPLGVTALRP